MCQYTIRELNKADLNDVHAIECASFITPWSYKSLKAELKNDLAYYSVAVLNERVVGFAGMWIIFDEAHITNIAVNSEHRRLGLGRALMLHMIESAKKREAQFMTLEVRSSNIAAQSLYAQLNFVKGGVRRGYYTDTKEDALILWKQLI